MEESQITKGELTRQEILAAASLLFRSQGYNATPMRRIAKEVGITPAAIYNYYPGKDQLFNALVQEAAPYNALFALFSEIEAPSPEDLIHQVFRASIAFVTEHQDYLQLALIDAQERDGAALASFLPQVLAQAETWHQRLLALDAGRGRSRLSDVPFPLFVRAMVSLLAGFLLTERVAQPGRFSQFEGFNWADALADVFLRGVLFLPVSPGEGDADA
ncbi:MAG: TetR/AcrR family transcriptional regulator [Anaerolinea sp.]|nr:TetR/AcrR family transcriptional regulator [Anaerolinea sp.]